MPALHALLIGINKYHKDSGVTPLDGCINDVEAVENMLQRHYQDLLKSGNITKLIDEEATRENIIQAFEQQLINKAEEGDTALLYYAGHGSTNPSSKEFKKFDGQEKDETFVCYDSRLTGKHDLADKEIAALLHRIKTGVHTVVIADSCHSGSVTRGKKLRVCPPREVTRSLQSYLLKEDTFYETMLSKNGRVTIPRSKHVLLSGCDRNQSSQETDDQRGLFTSNLLAILEGNQDLSYKLLFEEVRELVLKKSNRQQKPTVSPLEHFNPNTVFLRSNVQPNEKYMVKHEDGQWKIAFGAIYGLPAQLKSDQIINVGLYKEKQEQAPQIRKCTISKVSLTSSMLTPKDCEDCEDNNNCENCEDLDIHKTYWGEILNFPTTLKIKLKGGNASKEAFLKKYNQKPSAFIQFTESAKPSKYSVEISKDQFIIFQNKPKKVVTSIKKHSEKAIAELKQKLQHLAKYELTLNLANEESTLKEAVEVKFFEEDKAGELIEKEQKNVQLNYYKTEDASEPDPIFYQIQAKNTTNKPIYVALLHLSPEFGVNVYFPSDLLKPNSGFKVLDDQHALIISDAQVNQSTDVFKVVVSNRFFDAHTYILEDIKRKRSSIKRTVVDRGKKTSDWYVHTVEVTLVRS